MMEPMLKPFLEALENIHLNAPQIPFISNRTGEWISAQNAVRPAYWAEHLRNPVRFSAGLKCMLTEAPFLLLEVGPGRTLSGLARQIGATPQPLCSLPHASGTGDDQKFLLTTLEQLWLSDAPVDWPAYYRNERRRRIPLPTYPFQRQRYWIEPRKTEQAVAARPVEPHFTPKDSREQIDSLTGDGTLRRHERPDLASEYVEPRNMQESALAEIWQELLGVDRIGVYDNFFELGGQSLLGTQILARLKQDYGAALELNTLFENQTIAALTSAWLDQRAALEDNDQLSRLMDALDNMSEADVAVHLQGDTLPAELPGANLATVAEPEQPEGLVEATPHESGRIFPLVLRPTGAIDLAAWAQENRQYLQRQLTRYGAVLFKGFRIDGTEGFGRVARSLNGDLLSYRERTSPRHEVSDRIFTATDYPASQSIFLHNENSYAHTIPTKLLFYCRKPAQQGGETPIADCRRVLRRIDPEIVERFVKLKWMYVRNFSDQFGIPWQTAFQTTNKEELEAYCRQQDIEYEWTTGDLLRTRQIREAIIHHPHDGTPVWFNHATFFHVTTLEPPVRKVLLETFAEVDLPNNTYYGDGSSIEAEVINSLRRAYEEETATFPWEEHDLLLLDNLSTAHSRRPFKGPREILVAMSESVNRSDLVSAKKGARQTSVS
jgi:alpha-ketoglutarate-dependent taurine dioxygenase